MNTPERVSLLMRVLDTVRSNVTGFRPHFYAMPGSGDLALAVGDGVSGLRVVEIAEIHVARDVAQLSRSVFVVSPWISPGAAEILRGRGVSHGDGEGRLWLVYGGGCVDVRGPGVPPPARPSLADLCGPSRARAVVVLCEAAPDATLRGLAAVNRGTGLRALSEVATHLRACGYMRRSSTIEVDVHSLLPAWADVHRDAERAAWVAVRRPLGVDLASIRLSQRHAWSGVAGMPELGSGHEAAEVLHAYVENVVLAVDELGWEVVGDPYGEAGRHLFLREPDDRSWFDRLSGPVPVAPRVRVALDLLVSRPELRSAGLAALPTLPSRWRRQAARRSDVDEAVRRGG